MEITLKNKMKMKNQRNLSMKPGAKRACWLCRGALFAGLFFWMGLGGTQGQTPGLTYPVPLDEEHFPNGSFREEVSVYDADGDGSLSVEECGKVKELDLESFYGSSLEGVRYFYALEILDCSGNSLRSLDVSGLTALDSLDCSGNIYTLTSLNVSGCTALTTLSCVSNRLTSLDVSGLTNLTSLSCGANQLTSLDLSGCTALKRLNCGANQLTSLDLSGCTALKRLNCSDNQLASLDLGGLAVFDSLDCSSNDLMSLDLRSLSSLTNLDCSSNDLMSLDLRSLSSLTNLDCSFSYLTSLDLSEQTALVTLNCDYNYLTSLDLSEQTALVTLSCDNNYLTSLDLSNQTALANLSCDDNYLTSLDLSEQTAALVTLNCDNNQLTSLDLSAQTALVGLNCDNNQLTKLDVGSMYLGSVHCSNNQLASLDLSGRTLEILDCSNNQLLVLDLSQCESQYWDTYYFSNQIFIVKDTNRICLPDLIRSHGGDMGKVHDIVVDDCIYKDNIVQFLRPGAELRYVYETGRGSMESRLYFLADSDSAAVIIDEEHFPDFNFRRYVQENHDANQNGILEFAESNCEDGVSHRKDQIGLTRYSSTSEMFEDCKGLDVSGWGIADLSGIEYFRGLEALICQDNVLKNLDLTKCPDLKYLDCSGNRELSRIELSNDSLLLALDCNRTAIDLSQYLPRWKYIGELDCRDMQLTELDLSRNPWLSFVDCSNNRIDTLSLEGSRVEELYCNESDIRKIDMGPEMLPWLRVLFCNFNRLTELDLSLLPKLYEVGFVYNNLAYMDLSKNGRLRFVNDDMDGDSTENYHEVVLEGSRKLALSLIPGLDASRMSRLYGGTIQGDTLTFVEDTVSYYYDYRVPGDLEGGGEGGYFFLYLRGPVQIDETHFPDEAFRTYVAENLDSSANGYLESKESGIKALDVSGLGIRDLRGIGYFSELESLDCSANELTSLDLSGNPALQDLNAEGNRLEVTLGANNGFDLSTLPGFDVSKASDWEGGICRNNILTFRQREVTYTYATGYNGNTEDESLQSVRFSLMADREPGTANEIAESGQQGRVYGKDHVIHTEGIESEITVFTPSGILLYRGHDKEIPVRNDGVYIVRSGQQVWKVLVM